MFIEFIGGPCDGERIVLQGNPEEFFYLVASRHPERPVYRCSICPCCASKVADTTEVVDYQFVGYQEQFMVRNSTIPKTAH